ncbi:MAG: hypothetical protein H6Q74_628 [Firmicutes bacterium]|nr:hypothetical protein [Bacillota bacterium]
METWLAACLALAVVLAAACHMKIFIELEYNRQADDDRLVVRVWLMRWINYQMEVPLVGVLEKNNVPWVEAELEVAGNKITPKPGREQRYVKNLWQEYWHHTKKWYYLLRQVRYYTKLYRKIMNKIIDKLVCEKLVIKTKIGIGDPALTGIVVGLLWTIKSRLYLTMRRRLMVMAVPSFNVVPDFNAVGLEIRVQCIISVQVGNVIDAVLSIIKYPFKEATERGRASNTEFDENGNGKHKRYG